MNEMPPRENPRINISLDSVHASGPLGRAHCVIHGNCNYKQTGAAAGLRGVLAAAAAAAARRLRVRLPGVRPPRAARRAAQLRPGHGARRSPSSTASAAVRLIDYLDKGASLGPARPCLTMAGAARSYGEVQRLSSAGRPGAGPVRASGPATRWRSCPPTTRSRSPACSASPGPARCGARSTRATRRRRTATCWTSSTARCLIFQAAFAPLVAQIRAGPARADHAGLPRPATRACRGPSPFEDWLDGLPAEPWQAEPGGRHRDDRGDRRHHRPAQGRAADRAQHRDDDGPHADELPVRGPPRLPGPGPAHARRGGALLPGHDARRRDRHHARTRPGRAS